MKNLKNYAQLKESHHTHRNIEAYNQAKRCVRVIIQSKPTGKNRPNQTQLRKQAILNYLADR